MKFRARPFTKTCKMFPIATIAISSLLFNTTNVLADTSSPTATSTTTTGTNATSSTTTSTATTDTTASGTTTGATGTGTTTGATTTDATGTGTTTGATTTDATGTGTTTGATTTDATGTGTSTSGATTTGATGTGTITTGTTTSTTPLPFTDISNSYAVTQITDLAQRNIVSGSKGQFFPQNNISRAEFVTMLDRALQIQPVNSPISGFQDVNASSGDWYNQWVQPAVQLGIASGTSPTTFSPLKSISREEAATLLVKAIKALDPAHDIMSPFNDVGNTDTWADPYVAAVSRLGLMHGYQGDFRPTDPITRQEVAVVLDQLVQDPRWSGAITSNTPDTQVNITWQFLETNQDYENRVQASNMINTMSPRWFFLNGPTQLEDDAANNSSMVTWAHQNGKKIWPLFGNRFDKDWTHNLLATESNRQSMVTQLVNAAVYYQVDGLNIDFENLDPADKSNFTTFIQELTSALHQHNLQLSLDVPPDVGTDWDQGYDYPALGNIVDYMVLMGYDEHWNGDSQAGSVSDLPWLTHGLQTITAEIPKSKFILGMPLYTVDWYFQNNYMHADDLTIGEEPVYLQNAHAALSWNAQLGQYVATFNKSGVGHTIWVEDGRSLSLKYQMALNANIAGTAFWYAGAESPDIWQSLANVRQYDNFIQNAQNTAK